jgi:glycosyltransferase involved in cell wall biosynthesis
VVGVGWLDERKGFDLLIRAHAKVKEEGLFHRVVIVGEGPQRAALESLIAECDVSDSVLLPGFLTNPYAVVARASVFCMPSRFEGWPLALTEAVALGAPIVAADCVAGPREILADGRYGELVEVDSVEQLGDALARHLRNPDVLVEKARLGQASAETFSVVAAARAYLEVFEELVH